MSPTLRISIGANLVLLGGIAVLLWRERPADSASAVPQTRPAAMQAGSPAAPVVRNLAPDPAGPALAPEAVAQLERTGISRDILASILIEDFNRRAAKRLVALRKKYAPQPVPDRELRELARADNAEQVRELQAALGEAGYRAWDREQTLRALNRARAPGDELPMTAAEAEQACRLQKDFDEKNQELQVAMEDGVADRADVGALQAQAQQALDAELRKLLGPQRFNALRGEADPVAEVYRAFGDLSPTPSQAQAVLAADGDYHARAEALARQPNETPADAARVMAELKAMNEAREENLRRIFGAEAYDTLQRQNDPTYQALRQYAGAWQLDDREVQSVYDTLHLFQDEAARTRLAAEMREAAGQRVNWREIDAAIDQARRETEASLQALVGDERLRRLKQNGMVASR